MDILGYLCKGTENIVSGNITEYSFMMSEEEAEKVKHYFENLVDKGVKYNLGGSSIDLNATMCTESATNALLTSGGLSQEEYEIMSRPYDEWKKSMPESLPEGYDDVGRKTEALTSPNPNGIEIRIQQLKNLK